MSKERERERDRDENEGGKASESVKFIENERSLSHNLYESLHTDRKM